MTIQVVSIALELQDGQTFREFRFLSLVFRYEHDSKNLKKKLN